jgi:hypothetical protein
VDAQMNELAVQHPQKSPAFIQSIETVSECSRQRKVIVRARACGPPRRL